MTDTADQRLRAPRSRRRGAARALLGLLLAGISMAVFAAAAADAVPLRGDWLQASPGQTAAEALAPDAAGQFRPFDPTRNSSLSRDPDGLWVRLTPADGNWPHEPLVLQVPAPSAGPVYLYRSDGGAPQRADTTGAAPGNLQGHGRLAFRVSRPLQPGAVLLLYFEPYRTVLGPVRFELLPLETFFAHDTAWLAFASVCFAVMATMGIVALAFGLVLRDRTFHIYAAFVLSYALTLAIQNGYAFHPLGLAVFAGAPYICSRLAMMTSAICFVQFMSRFTRLQWYSPPLRRLISLLSWLMGGVLAFSLLPWQPARLLASDAIDTALLGGAVITLVCSCYTAYRGSRYALYFLGGWAPLQTITALAAAQGLGALAGWKWLENGNLGAGAFESVALSAGLAVHILSVRRERDRAAAVADRDALTGVLNRRGWTARLDELLRSEKRSGQRLAVMFIDIDHFKSLNDCFGHDEGDVALTRIAAALGHHLRPGDILGRYGGEEFVVILPGCHREQARAIGERVRAAVEALAIPNNPRGGTLTASVGIAIRESTEDLVALTGRADQAMYTAKRCGRNRVELAPPHAWPALAG